MNQIPGILSPMHLASIAQSPLFIGDDQSILIEFLSRYAPTTIYLSMGERLIFPSSDTHYLGIVLEGRLRVKAENLAISMLSSSDLFGAATLYGAYHKTATSITSESDSYMLLISAEDLDILIAEYPLIRHNYLCYLTGRIQFLSGRLRALGATTAEGKLARYLLSTSGEISCTATELAERIGVGRATLYRCLAPLEETGIISRTGRTLKILDYNRLSDYA